jgi:aminopeptidase YwaD
MNDWPDRYIHTNFDRPDVIDATKLLRAAFIGAASGYFLARASAADAPALERILRNASLQRTATMLARRDALPADEAAHLTRYHLWYERGVLESLSHFFDIPADVRARADARLEDLGRITGAPAAIAAPTTAPTAAGRVVYRRNPDVPGPTSVFGYDYLGAHYGEERTARLRLLSHGGMHGARPVGGGMYAYEVLNLVDGRRTAQDIRDTASAIYGPVPLEFVTEYLEALREIGLVTTAR